MNDSPFTFGEAFACQALLVRTAQLLAQMARRDVRYGLVTMCAGGGMGAAGIFERL